MKSLSRTLNSRSRTQPSNIFVDDSSSDITSEESEKVRIKAASVPQAVPTRDIGKLEPQISAPSYFNSLKENVAPPFLKPGKESRPKISIETTVTETDVVAMVAAAESDPVTGLKNYILNFLVEKKITKNYSLQEKSFLVNLITETIDYGAQRPFSAYKLACLLAIYLETHVYFKWYYWTSPSSVWSYFKEMMLRHTVEDSPDGQEVFEPEECYDILTHFHTLYISNLPLIHVVCFGVYKLKFTWPFKPTFK